MTVPGDLIPTSKAIRILRVNPSTLHRWRDTGKLRAWRMGGRYYYSEAEVRGLMRPVTPPVYPESDRERQDRMRAAEEELRAAGLKW